MPVRLGPSCLRLLRGSSSVDDYWGGAPVRYPRPRAKQKSNRIEFPVAILDRTSPTGLAPKPLPPCCYVPAQHGPDRRRLESCPCWIGRSDQVIPIANVPQLSCRENCTLSGPEIKSYVFPSVPHSVFLSCRPLTL